MISKLKLLWIFLSTIALLASTSLMCVSGQDSGLCKGESLSKLVRWERFDFIISFYTVLIFFAVVEVDLALLPLEVMTFIPEGSTSEINCTADSSQSPASYLV